MKTTSSAVFLATSLSQTNALFLPLLFSHVITLVTFHSISVNNIQMAIEQQQNKRAIGYVHHSIRVYSFGATTSTTNPPSLNYLFVCSCPYILRDTLLTKIYKTTTCNIIQEFPLPGFLLWGISLMWHSLNEEGGGLNWWGLCNRIDIISKHSRRILPLPSGRSSVPPY